MSTEIRTNEEFLRWLFDGVDGWDEIPFVCSIEGNPNTEGYGYDARAITSPQGRNNFFAVSSYPEPESRHHPMPKRSPDNAGALVCFVVDDVGTKIEEVEVEEILGRPSWVIETSPGNFQWGYKLTVPERDHQKAHSLIQAVCRVFTADVAGTNRVVRLPVGVNSKPKYGTPPPKTDLTFLDPTRTIPFAQAWAQLGARMEPLPPPPVDSPFTVDDDPVMHALRAAGRVKDASQYPTVQITCPWIDEHTDRRDDGSAYIAPTGFKCFHGHCEHRTFADLRASLGLTGHEVDAAVKAAAVAAFAGEDAELAPPAGATSAPTPAPPTPAYDDGSVGRFHVGGRVMTRAELQAVFPRRWVFEDLVAANSTWMIAGQGGIGKSRLALTLAMSVAAGIPVGPFRPAETAGIRTLVLTQEDDNAEKGHRYTTQLRWMERHYAEWRDPAVAPRLAENLFVPEVDPTHGLDDALLGRLQRDQLRGGPYQLIVFDPLIMFFEEAKDDDAGINSATGARKTFRKLMEVNRDLCTAKDLDHSSLVVHHLSKNGTVYGSVMFENLARTVLAVEKDTGYVAPRGVDRKRGTITITKANGISSVGQSTTMFLETKDAVVHLPETFEHLSDVDAVAKVLRENLAELGDTPGGVLDGLARRLPQFGDTLKQRKEKIVPALDALKKSPISELSERGLAYDGERFSRLGEEE